MPCNVETLMNKFDCNNHFKTLSSRDENSMSQVVLLLYGVLSELQRSNTLAENVSRKKTCWTAEDIAFQTCKSTVQSKYTCKPSFLKTRRLLFTKVKVTQFGWPQRCLHGSKRLMRDKLALFLN